MKPMHATIDTTSHTVRLRGRSPRLLLRAALSALTSIAGLCAASTAHAQAFPGTWTALTRGGAVITARASLRDGHLDVVGTSASPASYVHSDAGHFYLRVRVDGDPLQANGKLARAAWGCVIETDGAVRSYQYLVALDATPADPSVTLRHNPSVVAADTPAEIAEVVLASGLDPSTYAQTSAAGSDFFVDVAMPWSVLRGGTAPLPKVGIRFVCGTSTTAGNLNADVFDPGGTLSASWSDPMVCDADGCALDTDRDGVSDAREGQLGTNPSSRDTDGDGISDAVELGVSGSVGPFAAVDTDGDGTPDALDTDSDNDCVSDASEGAATFRDRSLPNVVTSTVCGGATPVCAASTGTCVACDASNGAGTAAACPMASAPVCQKAGALAGRCTQCEASNVALCSGATPACNVTTGACAACDADHGGAGGAVCPTASQGICQLTGALSGRCTECSATNVGACTASAPACDVATAVCAACNGDRGTGSTRSCPAEASPTCVVATGTCGRCTSNADCGDGHSGPTCETTTGTCVDKDSDGDGLNDSVERLLGTNYLAADTDGDGLDDAAEVTPPGGGPSTKVDSDGDGILDALDTDSDGDGLADGLEGTADDDGDGRANFRDADDDGDGIPTATEVADGKRAGVPEDVDGDGLANWRDTDADGDGKGDAFEREGDADGDGIPDYLDAVFSPPRPDAGPAAPPTPPVDTTNAADAGVAGEPGVIEGNGILCHVGGVGSPGSVGSAFAAVVVGLLAMARRRGRRA